MTQFIDLPKKSKNIAGQRFGRLVALGPVGYQHTSISWLCQCDCGKQTAVITRNLRNGNTKSCGCRRIDILVGANTIHSMSKTKIFHIWRSMIQRCCNPKVRSYPDYGGRGIKVCPEWQDSFKEFYDHVSNLPSYGEKGYTLDRIFNDGDYEPGNVKWSTTAEQHRNTRHNRLLTLNDKTQCVADWAVELKMSMTTLASRIKKGWGVERALTTPVHPRKKKEKP